MYAIKKIASIHITSAGCYFEDDSLELVRPDLRPSLEETSSYLLSYWSTISGTNSPQVGPAAAMVDLLWSKKIHIVQYCTKKEVNLRQHFRRGTAPSHNKLRKCFMDLCYSQKEELS